MKPSQENVWLSGHVSVLLDSFRELTGCDLIEAGDGPVETARRVFEAPFFVASHDGADDPVLTYGNSCTV